MRFFNYDGDFYSNRCGGLHGGDRLNCRDDHNNRLLAKQFSRRLSLRQIFRSFTCGCGSLGFVTTLATPTTTATTTATIALIFVATCILGITPDERGDGGRQISCCRLLNLFVFYGFGLRAFATTLAFATRTALLTFAATCG